MNVCNFSPEQLIQYNTLLEKCKKGFPNVPEGLSQMICETYVDAPNAFNKVCEQYKKDPNCFKKKYGLDDEEEDENVVENKE